MRSWVYRAGIGLDSNRNTDQSRRPTESTDRHRPAVEVVTALLMET